jgi:hypothetical protein
LRRAVRRKQPWLTDKGAELDEYINVWRPE